MVTPARSTLRRSNIARDVDMADKEHEMGDEGPKLDQLKLIE